MDLVICCCRKRFPLALALIFLAVEIGLEYYVIISHISKSNIKMMMYYYNKAIDLGHKEAQEKIVQFERKYKKKIEQIKKESTEEKT